MKIHILSKFQSIWSIFYRVDLFFVILSKSRFCGKSWIFIKFCNKNGRRVPIFKVFLFFSQFLLETNKMQYSSKLCAILDILLKSRGFFGLKKGQFQAIFIKGNMLIGRHPSRRKRPQIRQKSKFFNSVKNKMFQRGHSFI